MPPLEPVSLPIAVLPKAGECGRGLLLRTATANGFGFDVLGRLAGMKLQLLCGDQPGALASLPGVNPRWFCRHLVLEEKDDRRRRWRLLDHEWTASRCLRVRQPQVCPECLVASQYCQAVWSVSGYVACAIHGCPMESLCGHCAKPILWDRPAVNVCRCGWMLGRGKFSAEARTLKAWSGWVMNRMSVERECMTTENGAERCLLPRWIQGLSVDAAFQVLMALGIRQDRFQRVSTADAVGIGTPAQIGEIIDRGIERGWALDSPTSKTLQGLDGLVYEQGLERLAQRALEGADRVFATTLVRTLKRMSYRCRATGRRPVAVQADLFESSDA
jgi:hypothetical protein